ncbi:ISAzo13 family transposase [Methylomonas rapida]|uniref:ISAzo13 family transposase n=1 Tax=Methylomonas rapida TaxID=2963939 RepID=A0ABY7GG34_9GAMM|nr:ISAzo13 family transposase [Methylomonas rapida]WAR43789.1 ISAzo13 family transposase [Methylomonas rapida]
MIGYEQAIEIKMQRLFRTLSEKDKRRYAGIEATKLGHGGIDYISKLFDIDPKTVRRGLQELDFADDPASERVRKKGGGRKPAIEQQPQLLVNFLALLAEFTAGDPMREGVLWTNLSRCEISRRLREMGTPASRHTVRKLLRKHGLGQRKARKKKSMGAHPDRNAQFENIARLKAEYLAAGEPVISIDTKKKELIGDFAREGHTHTQAPVETLDHDFPSAGQGKLIPHGIYDVARNEGTIHLNTSHDTSELCCDSIALWWQRQGREHYPHAKRLLILCDGGGSNAANRHVFKEAVQALAECLGLEIRIAHYPPYCSKHNPIEHRLFPHITRACQGVVFHTLDIARQFMEKAKTTTGLKVTVDILTGIYETGKKCAADFIQNMRIVFDDFLPRWNYRALPQNR